MNVGSQLNLHFQSSLDKDNKYKEVWRHWTQYCSWDRRF